MKKDIEFKRLPDWMICGFDSFENYQDFYESIETHLEYINIALIDLVGYPKEILPERGDSLSTEYILKIRELVDQEVIIV